MRILSIGTDRSVFDPGSASARRMAGYGEEVERYDIIARTVGSVSHDYDLTPKVRVFAAESRGPIVAAVNFALAVLRARRSGRYDVVTAENPFDVGLAAWVAARLLGSAFHIQVHGDFYGSPEWRNASRANRRIKYPLAAFLAKRADGIRAVSERAKRGLVAVGVRPERVAVSPILGEPVCGSSATPVARSESPTVLYVGRFEREKDPLMLVEAFARVQRAVPEARLRLVGGGSEEDALRLRVASLALVESVDFAGWSDDLEREYRSAWTLAIPSDHEGWGRVAVEAASCGLPVVMTDVGCAGEFVRDGESGWVVPVGDSEAMAAALLESLRDRAEAGRRAEALAGDLASLEGAGLPRLVASWQGTAKAFREETAPAIRGIWRLLAIAIAAHAVAYLAFLVRFGTGGEWGWYTLGSDDIGYLRIAANIWHGVFSQSVAAPFVPDSDRMPLYPIFLSLLRFVPAWTLIAVQELFSIVGILLWYRLARFAAPERLAFWSAALFAIDPTVRFWSAQFATEPVFSVFWFGSLLAFGALLARGRPKAAAATGVLLGLSVLTRPIALFYPAVLLLVLAIAMRKRLLSWLRLSAMILACFAATLSPWVVRNAVVFGMPAVSLKGSGIMFGENAPTYLMWKYGISREEAFGRMLAMLPGHAYVLPYSNPELDRAVANVIEADPIGFAYVMSLSAIPFFLGDGYTAAVRTFFPDLPTPIVRWNGSVVGYLRDLASSGGGVAFAIYAFGKAVTASVALLALVGLAATLRTRERRLVAIWFAVTILYFAATSGSIAYSRYRFPIQPMLFLFACYGIMAVWSRARRAPAAA